MIAARTTPLQAGTASARLWRYIGKFKQRRPALAARAGAMKADRRTQGMPYLIIFIIVLVLGLMVSCVF